MGLVKVLAAFLPAEEEEFEELDINLFENIKSKIQYFVFKVEDVESYIYNELLDIELNNAVDELDKSTRNCLHYSCFEVNEEYVKDFCIEHLEDILDTLPRDSFYFEGETYLILESNG